VQYFGLKRSNFLIGDYFVTR